MSTKVTECGIIIGTAEQMYGTILTVAPFAIRPGSACVGQTSRCVSSASLGTARKKK
jgi:hypothetical protein